MHNFTIKKLENIKFNHNELLDYYNKIVKDYQHLKWTVTNDYDTKTHNVDNVYSWAIQSNLKDPTKPCPPYHIKHDSEVIESHSFDVETELNFGFGKKILDTFKGIRQTVIAAHPPGTVVDFHTDNAEFIKVHIPIITNEKSYFLFENEKFNLEVGNAYLVNTALPHGTSNEGDEDRVHFIFKIPKDSVDELLKYEYILDASKFDFDVLELPNIKFNYDELVDYYSKVENDFSEFKYIVEPMNPEHDSNLYPKGYEKVVGMINYAIQTNMKDASKPAPSFNVKTITKENKLKYFTNKTPLAFGFAEKVLNVFDKVEELVITNHPPNVGISPHIDNNINFRIHFPIKTNDKSIFGFDGGSYVLQPNKAYLVNTSRTHWTDNRGEQDRVHLFFKVPIGHINKILTTDYYI
jgi:aspartyl/asparaginyl beta-hydroxylase (cupin superfamily)